MPVVTIASHEKGQPMLVPENFKRWTDRLRANDISGSDVFVIATVGKYREGKSTLLNLISRYLNVMKGKNASLFDLQSWVEVPPNLEEKFATSSEFEGCTKGILVEIEPVIILDRQGKKFAVFIMDTQGLSDLDESSDPKIETALFLLANLFSSVLILNIKEKMDTMIMMLLTSFAMLANKFKKELGVNTNILRDLIIMVRDTELGDGVLGWEGGRKYMEKSFATLAARRDCSDIPNILRKTYHNISCFLAARPSNAKNVLLGGPSDIFLQNVQQLMEKLLSDPMLVPFLQNGRPLNCSALADHLDGVGRLFKEGKLPEGQDLLTVLRKNELQNVMAEAIKCYATEMQAGIMEKGLSEDQLLSLHKRCVEICKTSGIQNPILLTHKDPSALETVKRLDDELAEGFHKFKTINRHRVHLESEQSRLKAETQQYKGTVDAQNQQIKNLEELQTNAFSAEEKLKYELEINDLQHENQMTYKNLELANKEAEVRILAAEKCLKEERVKSLEKELAAEQASCIIY